MALIWYHIIRMTMQCMIWIYADVIWCHLVLSTFVPMQDLKIFVCLEFWFKHAVGGRAHRSLHLQCPLIPNEFVPTLGGEEMMHNAVQWQWYAMQKWWHAICETSCKAATLSPCQTWDSPLSTHGEKGRCASVVQLCISLMSFAKISQINYLRLWFRCATYPSDVWIYHTYMNTHMIYH